MALALIPLSALVFFMPDLIVAAPVLLVIPTIGIGIAGFGWKSIRQAEGELGGRRLVAAALAGHAAMLAASIGWHAHLDRVIHPPGYRATSFSTFKRTPADVEQLVGQNVVIGGWMYPGRESTGLTQFCLVDHLTGGFGASYRPDEQVTVALPEGTTTDYRGGWLLVTGQLENYDRRFGCPAGDCPNYLIHADHVRVAPISAELMNR